MESVEVINLKKFGGYENISVEMAPRPVLKEKEIRIKVEACGFNFSDVYEWQGMFNLYGLKLPFIMGKECSGVVEEINAKDCEYKVGDRVLCINFKSGLWASSVCVPVINCFKIPSTMSFEEAAAFPINYLTAYWSILDFGNLKPGQIILLQMAAGGVGCAAIQLIKTIPNVIIIGIASPWKHQSLFDRGVNHCFDSKRTDIVTEVLKLYPKGIDIILCTQVGSESIRLRQLLKPLGRIIHIGAANMLTGERKNPWHILRVWWQTKNIPLLELFDKNLSICGLNIANIFQEDPGQFGYALKTLFELYEDDKVKPLIHSVYRFPEIHKAIRSFLERKSIGKIILVPSETKSDNDTELPSSPQK